ncbi:MAG: hypothetical protein NTW87_15725 [Planctomycetota bacterium]|nr:hypothetical protein [Planctomycetota bacterium]
MDLIVNFGVLWLLHCVPALVFSLPLWLLGRQRAHWSAWEFVAVLIVPFLVWVMLYLFAGAGKYVSNMVWEAVFLGCAVPLAAAVRLICAGRLDSQRVAVASVVLVCLVGVALRAFVPPMQGK